MVKRPIYREQESIYNAAMTARAESSYLHPWSHVRGSMSASRNVSPRSKATVPVEGAILGRVRCGRDEMGIYREVLAATDDGERDKNLPLPQRYCACAWP